MCGVIITSAESHSALAAVRCLGKYGVKVACGEDKRAETSFLPMAFHSKYCSKRFVYPNPYEDAEGFIRSIIRFANKNKEYDVLMPINPETIIVSKYKGRIEREAPHLKVPVHEYKYIEMANDKRKVTEIANLIGVPTPKTYMPESLKEIEKIADEVGYPAVIKLPSAGGSKGLRYAYNKRELLKMYQNTVTKYYSNSANLPLIQEYIPGKGYGVSCLFNNGELRAIFTHKRRREVSVSGGPSVARISVRHKKMEEYAVKLLKTLQWHGVAMVEFKLDERDNEPKLLEINPRFWGSLYQAIAAGIEFPYLLYKIASEGDIKPVLNYKIGVKTRYMLMDLYYAFPNHLLRSKNRIKFLNDFFNFRGENYEVLSLDDPLPAMAVVLSALFRVIKTGHFGMKI